MAILANRVKTKNNVLEFIKFLSFLLKKLSIIILIFICLYLLRSPTQKLSRLSLEVSGVLMSVSSFISDSLIDGGRFLYNRLSYFRNLEAENFKLKLAIQKLINLQELNADLLAENNELRNLVKATEGLKYNHLSSRLVGVSITPISSSATIEAGSNDNVDTGNLVVNQDGLVGKVTNVSSNYSSVMLLNDPGSRVPVITSSSRQRGILAKQGDDMVLIYLPEEHKVEVGESVYTSGDGKLYPYGLLVGKVHKVTSEGVFVSLSVNLNRTEFVTIINQLAT